MSVFRSPMSRDTLRDDSPMDPTNPNPIAQTLTAYRGRVTA